MVAGFLSNQTQPQGCLQPGRNLISSSNKIDEIWKINTPFCLNKLVLKIYVNSNIFLNFTKKKFNQKDLAFTWSYFYDLWSLNWMSSVHFLTATSHFTLRMQFLNATAEIVQKSSATLAMKAWKYAEKLKKVTSDVLGKFICVLRMLRTMNLQYIINVTVIIKYHFVRQNFF